MKQKSIVALLSLLLLAGSTAPLSACGLHQGNNDSTAQPMQNEKLAQADVAPKSVKTLQTEDVTVGTGREAKKGDTVTVNYRGTLLNGKQFDSSYDRNEPFVFKLGAGQVIEGWDKGLSGMKVGGKRILTIPSYQAYGAEGAPPVIPPNAPLRFEVELLNVQ